MFNKRESHSNSTQSQTKNKNSNKPLTIPKDLSISPKPNTPKLPVHKKAAETISNKKQSVKQNQKSSYQKEITNSSKTTASHNNPAKKVKTNTNKQKKK